MARGRWHVDTEFRMLSHPALPKKVGACHPRATPNGHSCSLLSSSVSREKAQERPESAESCESGPLTSRFGPESESGDQKSQSSSSVATALPITYDEPDPLKKSWFSSAFGESADRIAGFTLVTVDGNIAS